MDSEEPNRPEEPREGIPSASSLAPKPRWIDTNQSGVTRDRVNVKPRREPLTMGNKATIDLMS